MFCGAEVVFQDKDGRAKAQRARPSRLIGTFDPSSGDCGSPVLRLI